MTEYRIYHRIQRPLFRNYRTWDRLWFDSTAYEVPAEEDTGAVELLEQIFHRHNRDDRPDGRIAPSLSVGDIVALDWGTEETTFWTVASIGWEQVEGPFYAQVANAAEDIDYGAAFDALEVGA